MGRAGSYEKNLCRAAPGWGTLPEPGADHGKSMHGLTGTLPNPW